MRRPKCPSLRRAQSVRENARLGRAGEFAAAALLQAVGLTVSRPEPDSFATDWIGTDWRNAGVDGVESCKFHFQVKTHAAGLSGSIPSIGPSLLRRSLKFPAFVLVFNGDPLAPKWWIASVFNWLKEHPLGLLDLASSVSLPAEAFDRVNDIASLRQLLVREYHERFHEAGPLWTPGRSSPLSALSAEDVFLSLGKLCFVEPSAALLGWVRKHISDPRDVATARQISILREDPERRALALEAGAPIPPSWGTRLQSRKSQEAKTDAAIVRGFFVEFARWTQGKRPRLPPYRWREMAVWRVLLDVWPAASGMILSALRSPSQWSMGTTERSTGTKWKLEEVAGALGLAGSLAYSFDLGVQSSARATLSALSSEASLLGAGRSQRVYDFQHALFYSMAQALPTAFNLDRCIQLFTGAGVLDRRELNTNKSYYRSSDDSAFRRSVSAKLQCPKPRDVAMANVLEAQSEIASTLGTIKSA